MEPTRNRVVLLIAVVQLVFCRSSTGEGILLPPLEVFGTAHLDVPGCSGKLTVNGPRANDSQPITVTAFFPLPPSSDDGGDSANTSALLHYLLPAALIAAENVNEAIEKEGLYNYHLQLDVRNSSGDRFLAVQELALPEPPGTNRVAVLGPGSLDVISSISPLAHRLHLPQVTYANETNVPIVTQDEKENLYPGLFLMVRNVYNIAKTALRVMHRLEWTEQVAFLFDDKEVYNKAVEQLVGDSDGDFTLSVYENITITVPASSFEKIPSDEKEESVREFMMAVRRNRIRVIAGLVGEDTACRVICDAKAGVIPGDGFAYIFVGGYQDEWWKTCSCGLVSADVESVITVSSQVKNTSPDYEFELGNNLSKLKNDYVNRLNKWCPETIGDSPNTFFATTYDSLLALGLAIKSTLPQLNALQQNPYGNETKETVFNSILNSLSNSNFTGVSGRVKFSSIGERIGVDIIQQIQDGIPVVVGTYDSNSESLDINDSLLLWPGGEVPRQFPTEDPKTAPLFIILVVLIATLSSNIGTIVLMIFVVRHRNHRLFRASGMRLNYFVFSGAYMAYTTLYIYVILESKWGEMIPHQLFTFLCIFRLYTIVLSFTLTFGTLFLRAWRIYRIFNNPFVARKKYTDSYLMLLVGALALIDIVIVTLYAPTDGYGKGVSRADPDYDSFTQCTRLGCFSRDYFLLGNFALGGYKFMQIFLFIFVVSLVRQGVIERKIYDDSKYLAIALYVTAVVFIVGFPLQILLLVSFKIAEGLLVNMVWLLTATDVTLVAIYVPKLYQIIYKKVDVRKLMQQKSKFYLYSSETRSTIL